MNKLRKLSTLAALAVAMFGAQVVNAQCVGGSCRYAYAQTSPRYAAQTYRASNCQTCCASYGCAQFRPFGGLFAGLFGASCAYQTAPRSYACQGRSACAVGASRSCPYGNCANGTCQSGTCQSGTCQSDSSGYYETPTLEEDRATAPTSSPIDENQNETNERPVLEKLRGLTDNVCENVYIARVNAVRTRHGLRPLQIDATLDAQCAAQSQNMAVAGYIYHASGCGFEIVAANGGAGIDGALNQWQASGPHAQLLLNPSFTRCGVQTYKDRYGRNYCTMRFK